MMSGRNRVLDSLRTVAGYASVLVGTAACSGVTEPCVAPLDMMGTWSYAAEQQSPSPATLTGTLVVTHQTCRDFDGAVDLVQVDARGERRVAGRVAGRVLDVGSLQFDASLGAVPRQHLATLSGNAFAGSWLEIGGGSDAAGAFHGKREVGP
jgi:hypothetical protein